MFQSNAACAHPRLSLVSDKRVLRDFPCPVISVIHDIEAETVECSKAQVWCYEVRGQSQRQTLDVLLDNRQLVTTFKLSSSLWLERIDVFGISQGSVKHPVGEAEYSIAFCCKFIQTSAYQKLSN